ncbi:MAG: TetR/AcrR family transcriptional regulator, partial [Planctomycetota bacterium]
MPRKPDTKNELMDVAQELIQERGYHAFSFKDVAARVGIKTASMHYHFPAKPDLATALLVRYRGQFQESLDAIRAKSALKKLDALVGLFESTHELGRMCLCGTLAADLNSLPEEVHAEVSGFYDDLRDWIRDVLKAGAASGELRKVPQQSTAEAVLGLLEGA